MKRLQSQILSIWLVLMGIISASAQEVMVTVQPVMNPLPPQVLPYVDDPGRFFTITLSNPTDEAIPVYLGLQIEQIMPQDFALNTPVDRLPSRPYMLRPQSTVTLGRNELNILFREMSVNDISLTGGILSDFTNGVIGLMPEGKFKGFVTAYKWDPANTHPQAVSNPAMGYCYFDICYKAPAPQITYPASGMAQSMGSGDWTTIEGAAKYESEFGDAAIVDFTKPVMFQWLPSRTSCGTTANSQVNYSLEFYHLQPGIALSDVVNYGKLVYKVPNLMTTGYMYNQPQTTRKMTFVDGEYYAMRVVASTKNKDSSKPEYMYIANDGISPFRVFRVGEPAKKEEAKEKEEEKKALLDSALVMTVPKLERKGVTDNVYYNIIEQGSDLEFEWESPEHVSGDTLVTDTLHFTYKAGLYRITTNIVDVDSLLETKPLYSKELDTRKLTLKWDDDLKKHMNVGEQYMFIVEPKAKNAKGEIADSLSFTGRLQNAYRFTYPVDYTQADDCFPGFAVANQFRKEFSDAELKKGFKITIGAFDLHVLRASVNEDYKGTPKKEEKKKEEKKEEPNKENKEKKENKEEETIYHQGKPDHSKDKDPGKDARPSLKDEPAKDAPKDAPKDGETPKDGAKEGADGEKKEEEEKDPTADVLAYKGEGYIVWRPYGKDIKIAVEFDSLVINTDNEVIKGMARSKKLPVDFVPYDMLNHLMKKWELNSYFGNKKFSQDEFSEQMEYLKSKDDFAEYYRYCHDGMGYANTILQLIDGGVDADMGAQGITLPLGLPTASVPSLPLDISLVNMRFSPTTASLDLLAMFKMPESDHTDMDVLAFAAPGLCITPESAWAESGQCGLLFDMTLKDPDTGYKCSFKAPSNMKDINDGTFVSWENGKFDFLTIDMEMNIPGLIPVDAAGKRIAGQNGATFGLKAKIADWDDWTAQVDMSPFEVEEAPGYIFSPTGTKAGILYDHSKSFNVNGMTFPAQYDWSKWGLSKEELKSPKSLNAWQGFYLEELSVIFPEIMDLDTKKIFNGREEEEAPAAETAKDTSKDASKDAAKDAAKTDGKDGAAPKKEEDKLDPTKCISAGVKGLMIDKSGVSLGLGFNNIVDFKGYLTSFRLTISELYLNIVQNNFNNSGFKGEITVPLLSETFSYDAKMEYISKGENKEKSLHYAFNCVPKDDIKLDFLLAELTVDNSGTYFKVDKFKDEDANIEFITSGTVTIAGADKVSFKLPGIRFAGMRVANSSYNVKDENRFSVAYSKAIEKSKEATKKSGGKDEYADVKKTEDFVKATDDAMVRNELKNDAGTMFFSLGNWSFSSPEKKFWNLPLTLKNIDLTSKNDSVFGLKLEGGIKMLGNKKNGIGAIAGITIWSDVDWDEFEADYLETKFNSLELSGAFGGVVTVTGKLELVDEEKESGWGGSLAIDVKELFKIDVAGKYMKFTKTDAEFKKDNEDEKNDSTFNAGYFIGSVKGLPAIGPVTLNGVSGGYYFNYGLKDGGGYDDPEAFEEALKNPVRKYKCYGGAFGLGINVGGKKFMNGDMNLVTMIDMETNRVADFHLQGNIHALCASKDADSGLINARADIIYSNRTDSEDETKNEKKFKISITVDGEATMAEAYKQFTGKDLKVPKCLADLTAFDAQTAEDQGDNSNGNDHSETNADGTREESAAEKKAEENGFLSGGCSAHLGLEFEVRYRPKAANAKDRKKWHLYLGEPDENKRCRITFIDFAIGKDKPVGVWAKLYANAYLCLGNELPNDGALPEVPADVMEALGMKDPAGNTTDNMSKLEKVREETLRYGPKGNINGGIMIGAAVGAEFGCNAVFCYCDVAGKLGFDLVLKQFAEDCMCTDGHRMGGKNGFYATGQLYSMLKGELGLMIDIWIYKGKIPLVDMTLGAMLKGGFPNPAWAYGRVRAKGSILGGLIKFSSTIEMKVGRVCIPEYGNPLDDIKIFSDVAPGADKLGEGWNKDSEASCYANPAFTTGMRINSRLTLVDHDARARRAGMTEDEEKYDASSTRTYVFHLMPQFKMEEFQDGTTDKSGVVSTKMVDYETQDYENFIIKAGSLKAHKYYKITLAGYCKEVRNGREVDPVFKDKESDYKEEHRKWEQEYTQYFYTGGYSSDINDDVMGYMPSGRYATLDELSNPYVMLMHDRSDYWNTLDSEFYMDIREKRSFPTIGEELEVYPDLQYSADGVRISGQKSMFEKVPVIQRIEHGVDETGRVYEYANATISNPLPSQYFKRGGYTYEIYKVNTSDFNAFQRNVEEKFESIMKLTSEDMANMKEEVQKLKAESKESVMKDMCDYYLQMEELYGPNEAEQRLKKYKDSFKKDMSAFYVSVVKFSAGYFGHRTFKEVIDNDNIESVTYELHDGRRWTNQPEFCVNKIYLSGTSTKSNNPYYALNYWHSKAAVWMSKLPKYKLCSYPMDFPYSLTYTPARSSWKYRYNPQANGTPMTDEQFEQSYRPDYAYLKASTKWHYTERAYNYTEAGKSTPYYLIRNLMETDARTVEAFEEKLADKWWWNTGYKKGSTLRNASTNDAGFSRFKDAMNASINAALEAGIKDPNNPSQWDSYVSIPEYQMGLIYAVEDNRMGLSYAQTGKSPKNAHLYMSGEWSGFSAEAFENRLTGIDYTFRRRTGYNIEQNEYGILPSTAGKYHVIVKARKEGGSSSRPTFSTAENDTIHIPDPQFRAYILMNYDRNGDGKFNRSEADAVETIINRNGGIRSFQGIETMKNLKNFTSSGDIIGRPINFSFNDKLEKLELYNYFAESIDLHNLKNLKVLRIRGMGGLNTMVTTMSNYKLKSLDIVNNTNLTTLDLFGSGIRSFFGAGLENLVKLEYIDIRGNQFVYVDLSNQMNLKTVYAGWQYKKVSEGVYQNNNAVTIRIAPSQTLKDYLYNTGARPESEYDFNKKYDSPTNVYQYNANVFVEGVQMDVDLLDPKLKEYLLSKYGVKTEVNHNFKQNSGANSNSREQQKLEEEMRKQGISGKQPGFNSGMRGPSLGGNSGKSVNSLPHSADVITLSKKDTEKVTDLRIADLGIKSLIYLEYWFPNLTTLDISGNDIRDLDLSKFTKLKYIYCKDNGITRIRMLDNSPIVELHCSNNALVDLDLINAKEMIRLDCSGNALNNLRLVNCSKLMYLDCSDNFLKVLDLRDQTGMKQLDCSNNDLMYNAANPFNVNLILADASARTFEKLECSNMSREIVHLPLKNFNLKYLVASNLQCTQADLPRNLLELTLKNAKELTSLCGGGIQSITEFKNIRRFDISGCEKLKLYYKIETDVMRNLAYLDVTDTDVYEVRLIGDNNNNKFNEVRCGVPGKRSGYKVKLWMSGPQWTSLWDSKWKFYPENEGTVYGLLMDGSGLDETGRTTVEAISDEDARMKEDLGNFYYDLKKELAPESRVIHVADMDKLTEFDCSFAMVSDLDKIIKWMPKLEKLNAAGNYIKTADIAKHCPNLKTLNLSQNGELVSLTLPEYMNSVDVSGTNLSNEDLFGGIAASCSPFGKLTVKNWMPQVAQHVTLSSFNGLSKLILEGGFNKLTVTSRIDSLECVSSGDYVKIFFPEDFAVFQFNHFDCSKNKGTVTLRFSHASSALHWYSTLSKANGNLNPDNLKIEIYGLGEGTSRNIFRFGSPAEIMHAVYRGWIAKGEAGYYNIESGKFQTVYDTFIANGFVYNPKYYRENSTGGITFTSLNYGAGYPTTVKSGDSRYDKSLDVNISKANPKTVISGGSTTVRKPTGGIRKNVGTTPAPKKGGTATKGKGRRL